MHDQPGDHDHDHAHAHEHEHEHEHDHDHDHDHDHEDPREARDKHVVMAFIEALVEERLSVNAKRAVFGILSVDPTVRDASM